MPTVSEQLRMARETQSLSVEEVSEATKIKSDHIRALDAGDYETFSAPVYIKGFVRSYASLLKLEVPSLLASLEDELRQSKNFSESPALSDRRRNWVDWLMYQLSKVKWRIMLPIAGITLVTLGIIWGVKSWRDHKTRDPLSELGSGLYQTSKAMEGETLPVPQRK